MYSSMESTNEIFEKMVSSRSGLTMAQMPIKGQGKHKR
jgi:hypothetical protein